MSHFARVLLLFVLTYLAYFDANTFVLLHKSCTFVTIVTFSMQDLYW